MSTVWYSRQAWREREGATEVRHGDVRSGTQMVPKWLRILAQQRQGGNSSIHFLLVFRERQLLRTPSAHQSVFLTPYCIPIPVLVPEVPRSVGKTFPSCERLFLAGRKTRLSFQGMSNHDSEPHSQCKMATQERPYCSKLPVKGVVQAAHFG